MDLNFIDSRAELRHKSFLYTTENIGERKQLKQELYTIKYIAKWSSCQQVHEKI